MFSEGRRQMSRIAIWLSIGIVAGLAVSQLRLSGDPRPLHAMTAHGTDKKTMITVPLDAGMEAVVALDHVTCDLTGYVLDRFSGKFFMRYRYNVSKDFPLQQGKLPRFLMAAGNADFRQFARNERVADGVIYVSEESSGQVVAYGIPWNTQFRVNTAPPQERTFIPLDLARTRFVEIGE